MNGKTVKIPYKGYDAKKTVKELGDAMQPPKAAKATAKPPPEKEASVSGGRDGSASVKGQYAEGAGTTRAKNPANGNQDGIAMGANGEHLFIAVADEAGGGGLMKGGAGSSKVVLDELQAEIKRFSGKGLTPEQVQARLEAAVQRAHQKIVDAGGGAYTTVSAAVRVGNKLVTVQVGDSTIAVVRKGKVVFQSEEDNIGRKIFDRAQTAQEQRDALRSANIINEAVGGQEAPRPRVRIVDYEPGDRVIAFSDGVGDAQLRRATAETERGIFQNEWHGDQMLKDIVAQMMKEPMTWRERFKEMVMRYLGRATGNNGMKSPDEAVKAVRDLVEYLTSKGWAKPDDLAFGVLDLK